VSTSSLLAYVEGEAKRQRALGTTESLFLADQMERVAQLLRFTDAETAEEFDSRIECNEDWVKEEAYSRGYAEGRSHGISEAKAVINAAYGHRG
jgi:hypothetical protein